MPDDTVVPNPIQPAPQPEEAAASETAVSAPVEAAAPDAPVQDTPAQPAATPAPAEAAAAPTSEPTLSVNGVSVTAGDVAALLAEVQQLRTWHDLKEAELTALRAELAERRAAQ